MDYLASEHRRKLERRNSEGEGQSELAPSASVADMTSVDPREARFFGYTTTTVTSTSTSTATSYTTYTTVWLSGCLPSSFAYAACG